MIFRKLFRRYNFYFAKKQKTTPGCQNHIIVRPPIYSKKSMAGESDSDDELECKYCDKTYTVKSSLNRHIAEKHANKHVVRKHDNAKGKIFSHFYVYYL